jgi:hypothetical protein
MPTSRYHGVSWYPQSNKWRVFSPQTETEPQKTIGYFYDEEFAAHMYDEVARTIPGALLNFP